MSGHPGNISIIFEDFYIILYDNAEKNFALYTVGVVGIEISSGTGDSNPYVSMQFFLDSFCHCLCTFPGIDTILANHFFVHTNKNLGFIEISDISSREDGRRTFRICDHRCDQTGGAAFHCGNRNVSIN